MIMPSWKDGMTTEEYEGQMAAAVAEARKAAPGGLVLAYSGWRHAAKQTWENNGVRYHAAASQLPPSEVTTVTIESDAGFGWTCWGIEGCGVHDVSPHRPLGHSRGVTLGVTQDGFDAVAYTGKPSTASPPAQETRPPAKAVKQ